MHPYAIPRAALFTAATLLAASLAPFSAAGAGEQSMLLPPAPKQEVSARLLFLPDDLSALDAPVADGQRRVLITGAYSSGDRFAPEGFVLRRGDAKLARLQGWDGLLLIDGSGLASLHDVSRVRHADRSYDLRDRAQRRAFVAQAEQDGLSAVQSHLLINEGALDLKPSETAPRFRRRLLFETKDGRLGVYDSSPAMLTLYEAAAALQKTAAPRFALNLDMGTYDFCEQQTAEGSTLCGLLNRAGIGKLTNVLALTAPAGQ